jgi:hypothetical protein
MFGLTDQIDTSFHELMEELRAIRRELALIRAYQEQQNGSARTNLRSVRGKASSKKKTA